MNPVGQIEPLHPLAGEPASRERPGHGSQAIGFRISSALQWVLRQVRAKQAGKNLRVCETVSLGEKRFVAVVQVDGERFLIGGASTSVSLLTRLQESKTYTANLARVAEKIS